MSELIGKWEVVKQQIGWWQGEDCVGWDGQEMFLFQSSTNNARLYGLRLIDRNDPVFAPTGFGWSLTGTSNSPYGQVWGSPHPGMFLVDLYVGDSTTGYRELAVLTLDATGPVVLSSLRIAKQSWATIVPPHAGVAYVYTNNTPYQMYRVTIGGDGQFTSALNPIGGYDGTFYDSPAFVTESIARGRSSTGPAWARVLDDGSVRRGAVTAPVTTTEVPVADNYTTYVTGVTWQTNPGHELVFRRSTSYPRTHCELLDIRLDPQDDGTVSTALAGRYPIPDGQEAGREQATFLIGGKAVAWLAQGNWDGPGELHYDLWGEDTVLALPEGLSEPVWNLTAAPDGGFMLKATDDAGVNWWVRYMPKIIRGGPVNNRRAFSDPR